MTIIMQKYASRGKNALKNIVNKEVYSCHVLNIYFS